MDIAHLTLLITLCVGVHGSEHLQRQKRWILDAFEIDEGYDGEYPYLLGRVKIEDEILFLKMHGQGVEEEPHNVLTMDPDTGDVWVLGPVDYEQFQKLHLTFQAIDKHNHEVNTQLGMIVYIVDSNDSPPTFDRETYEISVKESTSQGTDLITVRATDKDLTDTFRQFDLQIVSVSPQQPDVEFYLTTQVPHGTGTLSFKGCLDHEQAASYTIIVEAKDHGQLKLLSSSCTIVLNIEDQNNHLPVITQQKAVVRVREDQENVLLLRVPVTDEDTEHTPSWRVTFDIQEDTDDNFKITTNNKTNEGLLYLQKNLDHETTPVKNIIITAKNEIPFYFCNVLERNTMGLWKVAFSDVAGDDVGGTPPVPPRSRQQVTVIVENVNEAPIFDHPDQNVIVMENIKAGTYLKTFSAKDPDVRSANTIVYKIGKDPAGWVTVDAKNGSVTTSKILDRESPFVNNSVYVATIHAADDEKRPMTGTATLTIRILDLNDNAPFLVSNTIDMCQSDKRSLARIEGSDPDQDPNAGPFSFKLLGDVKDKWMLKPSHGLSVDLVKESIVHSGHHDLMIEVADLQGSTAVHNLSVTVCTCSDQTKPNCRLRKSAVTSAGGAIGIILFSLLLFAGLLLLGLGFSRKSNKIPLPEEGIGNLMISNNETKGTDCEVTFDRVPKSNQIQTTTEIQIASANRMYEKGMLSPVSQAELLLKQPTPRHWLYSMAPSEVSSRGSTQYTQLQTKRSRFVQGSMLTVMGASSNAGMGLQRRASNYTNWSNAQIQRDLTKKLHEADMQSNKLYDHQPRVYAEEGNPEPSFDLDALSISEVNFDPNSELDLKFKKLASVCMPIDNPQG